jgi:ATP-dependent exoDNAse (exonuclease V) beta subunit
MPSIIINASAGSGKTYRLAVAYIQALLQLLPDGTLPSPQCVLATTFTRAAASEILERVLRRLAMAVLSPEEATRLLSEIGRPDLQQADLVRLQESVCQSLSQLQVGTIDGIFSRIVRVLGLELGFPPTWTNADDTTATEMAFDVADRMLSAGQLELTHGQWQRYSQFKSGVRIRQVLVELLEDNRFHFLDAEIPGDSLEVQEPAVLSREEASLLVTSLDGCELPLTKGKNPKPHASWVKALEKLKLIFDGEPTLISILKGHSLMRLVEKEGATYYQVPVPESLREILAPVAQRGRADLRRLHDARLPALAALGRRFHELRGMAAHSRAAYRFAEIESAVRILPPHLSEEDLYFRLDGQIEHLLLDEFQDTSLGQFRFLWPIIEDVRANGRLFFAVGDTKQSIYGWRGADRRLLDRLPDWLDPESRDPDLKREHLSDNWRSSPAVLESIDQIFVDLPQADCLNPEGYKDATKAKAKARQSGAASFTRGYRHHFPVGDNRFLAGRTRLLLTGPAGGEEEDEESGINPEVEMIINTVQEHLREDPEREIAILCRRHKLMPSILTGLKSCGIPASGEGGNPVTDSAAVEVILSMLTWLDHPGHTLAREHAKLSVVSAALGFDPSLEDLALLDQLHTRIMRAGLAEVISTWIRHPDFLSHGNVHDHVRIEQLLELARGWDASGGGRLSAFVALVRAQRVGNPLSAQVRVMTIHGSKGLEFEAVILADLEASGGGGDGPHVVLSMAHPQDPPKVILLPSADDAEFLGLEAEYAQHLQEKFEEDLSVLYVALTRAKSFLDVVLPVDDRPTPSLSAILRERWGHQEPGVHVIEQWEACPGLRSKTTFSADEDPGIWRAGDSVPVEGFNRVPSRLEAITPSGQEGQGIMQLGLILNAGSSDALERGTAVHALLSKVEWVEDLPALDAWIQAVSSDEADPRTCKVAARELFPRLSNSADPLSQLLQRATWLESWKNEEIKNLEVWRERRFAAVFDRELMNGSFDRVVLGLDAAGKVKRAQILDFKTDRLSTEEDREARRLHYQPQLDAYAKALCSLANLKPAAVSAQLVWIN